MKNSKGISLIALIITIIVIIILAAIVIGGVFNTPNDAKFANFCQEYDRVQTAVQLRYYQLYQKYAIDASLTEIPTHYQIYYEVASGNAVAGSNKSANDTYSATYKDQSRWVEINFTKTGTGARGDANPICEKPNGLDGWYLRTNDGKLAYHGFEKGEKEMYYTPSVSQTAATRPTVTAAAAGGADSRAASTATVSNTDLNTLSATSPAGTGLTYVEALKTLAK